MGRAIVREPAVFLFDEPLSNLDAKLRVQMRFEIQQLHRRLGTTSLYVTHDQVEAMTLAQRMIVMNAGRAEQIGTPMEVYDDPATMFVAGFIGSPAMNFMPGRAAGGGAVALDAGGRVDVAGAALEAGRPVMVGARPEHLAPCAEGEASFAGPVEMVEQLGADALLHLGHGSERLLVRVPHGIHPAVGTTLHVRADPDARPALRSGGWRPHPMTTTDRTSPTAGFAHAWPYPRLVAHRGAGKLAPENTLTAMRVGHAHGYRMVEFDVKLAADNLSFLLHDETLERTTSGRGRADALPWRELSRLDAGGWHSAKYAGEPLPTLAAIARWARAHGVMCNIEIKPTPGRERETGAAVALDAATLWRDAEVPPLLSSFAEESLAAARDAVPALPRALLLDDAAGRLEGAPRAARLRGGRRRPPAAHRRTSSPPRAPPATACCAGRRTRPSASPSWPRGASTASSPTPSTASPPIRCRRRCRCPEPARRPAPHAAAGRRISRSSIGRLMRPATTPSAIASHQTTS